VLIKQKECTKKIDFSFFFLFFFLMQRLCSFVWYRKRLVQIFIQQNILGAMKLLWKLSKILVIAG